MMRVLSRIHRSRRPTPTCRRRRSAPRIEERGSKSEKTVTRRSILDPRSSALVSHRAAATLTEVLVSLAIMSIGVVALASLFPIAVLRAVQATHLTNATILRYDVEAVLRANPGIVLDPDAMNDPNVPGDAFREHAQRRYVVDPHAFLGNTSTPAALRDGLGHDGAGALSDFAVRRFRGGSSAAAVKNVLTLPDSWNTYGEEAVPVAITSPTTAMIDSVLDLNGVDLAAAARWRIVLHDPVLKIVETRDITDVNTTTSEVTFSPPVTLDRDGDGDVGGDGESPDPDFNPVLAYVQVQEGRYSALLTVTNRNGVGIVNVAVMLNRSTFDEESEFLYPITVGFVDLPQANNTGGMDPPNGVYDSNEPLTDQITVDTSTQALDVSRGDWLLDVDNLNWYRIRQVVSTGGGSTTLQLEENARRFFQHAVFLPRVLDVYPIGSITPHTP